MRSNFKLISPLVGGEGRAAGAQPVRRTIMTRSKACVHEFICMAKFLDSYVNHSSLCAWIDSTPVLPQISTRLELPLAIAPHKTPYSRKFAFAVLLQQRRPPDASVRHPPSSRQRALVPYSSPTSQRPISDRFESARRSGIDRYTRRASSSRIPACTNSASSHWRWFRRADQNSTIHQCCSPYPTKHPWSL